MTSAPVLDRRRLLALGAGALLAACSRSDRVEARLVLGTGPEGGVYAVYGAALAAVWEQRISGLAVEVVTTAASVENLALIRRGRLQAAITQADAAVAAYDDGEELFALARLYDDRVHLIVRGGEIDEIDALRRRAVAVGAPGSGTAMLARRMLVAAGLDGADGPQRADLGLRDGLAALAERKVDAVFWSGGVPSAAIEEALAADATLALVDVDVVVPALQERYGTVYARSEIGGAHYGLPRAVGTVSVPNFLVVAELDERLAWLMTAAMFDGRDELADAHPEGRNLDARTAIFTQPVPLHPGAAEFYRSLR